MNSTCFWSAWDTTGRHKGMRASTSGLLAPCLDCATGISHSVLESDWTVLVHLVICLTEIPYKSMGCTFEVSLQPKTQRYS